MSQPARERGEEWVERGEGSTFKLCCVSVNTGHEGEDGRLIVEASVGDFLIFF